MTAADAESQSSTKPRRIPSVADLDLQALAEAIAPALGPILAKAIEDSVVRELRHQRRTSPAPDGLMTLAQGAAYLNVSPKTLCAWRSEGRVKALLVGRRWRYPRAALDKVAICPWHPGAK